MLVVCVNVTYVVLGVVGEHDEELELHALVCAAWDEHVLGPSAAAVLAGVGGAALAGTKLVEGVGVGQGHARVDGVAADRVCAGGHCTKEIRVSREKT